MLTVRAQSPSQNISPPDNDPGPSNPAPNSLPRDTKDSIPTSDSNEPSRPEPPVPHSSPPQPAQVLTEAASVHSLPIGHVSTVHAPPQRPSTARSPPSPGTYTTPPSQLHSQSSSVTVHPTRDRLTRRRSTMEVNSHCLYLFANSPEG